MRRVVSAIVAMLAVTVVITGCASSPGSGTPSATTSTADSYAKQAVCAAGSAGISLIRAGGAGSKALAELIAANVQDQNIKNMANAVVNSTAGDDVRNQLADWLAGYCGS